MHSHKNPHAKGPSSALGNQKPPFSNPRSKGQGTPTSGPGSGHSFANPHALGPNSAGVGGGGAPMAAPMPVQPPGVGPTFAGTPAPTPPQPRFTA